MRQVLEEPWRLLNGSVLLRPTALGTGPVAGELDRTSGDQIGHHVGDLLDGPFGFVVFDVP